MKYTLLIILSCFTFSAFSQQRIDPSKQIMKSVAPYMYVKTDINKEQRYVTRDTVAKDVITRLTAGTGITITPTPGTQVNYTISASASSSVFNEQYVAPFSGPTINILIPVPTLPNRFKLKRTGVEMRNGVDYTITGTVLTLIIPAQDEDFILQSF